MNDSKTVVEDLPAWLGRIWDEEEAAAQIEQIPIPPSRNPDGSWMTIPGAPKPGDARMLARIAADRKILELHKGLPSFGRTGIHCRECRGWGAYPCTTVRLLASPHKDRPGFRPEWSVGRQGVEW